MNISEDMIGRLRDAKHVLVFTGAGVSAPAVTTACRRATYESGDPRTNQQQCGEQHCL